MARTLKSDKMLFLATLLLVGASAVMVYSASAVQAMARYQAPYYFLYKQLAWVILGVGLMLAVMRVDYREYRRPAVIWSLVAVTVLMLIAVFFFEPRNNTQRWITLDIVSIQPSELAKLAAILFTAALLERRMHRIDEVGYSLAPIGVLLLVFGGLIVKQPDFGTAAVLVAVVATMVFAAGLSYRYVFGAALLVLPVAALLVFSASYRLQRVLTYLDPWKDPLGEGYQTINSLLAVGSGGVFGLGLMGGIQKLYYIPEPHTDFIYAVIAEEFGLIGTTLTLACFAVIAWRGLRVSLLAPDRFASLLSLGITAMVVLQACLNISVVTALLPTKGIPLPFVSNGGSSLVINLVAMGILLNISRQLSPTAATVVSTRSGWRLGGQEA